MHDKPEIETASSEVVYRNRWMTVREDRIVRSSGQTGIYGVVEKPDFAVVVALDAGKLHLVQQYRYPVRQRYWEFPQGSWEHQAEVDPRMLALAELREETGLTAGVMQHAGHLFAAYGYATQGYNIYLATQLQQVDSQRDPEEEGMVARAFAISDVETMLCNGTIKDATTAAAFCLLRLKGLL